MLPWLLDLSFIQQRVSRGYFACGFILDLTKFPLTTGGIKGWCQALHLLQRKNSLPPSNNISSLNATPFSRAQRMCNHKEIKYKCGCSIYEVEAWCEKYQQTHVPCGPNPIKKSVSIVVTQHTYRLKSLCIQGRAAEREMRSVIPFDCTHLHNITDPIGSCIQNEHNQRWLTEHSKKKGGNPP